MTKPFNRIEVFVVAAMLLASGGVSGYLIATYKPSVDAAIQSWGRPDEEFVKSYRLSKSLVDNAEGSAVWPDSEEKRHIVGVHKKFVEEAEQRYPGLRDH